MNSCNGQKINKYPLLEKTVDVLRSDSFRNCYSFPKNFKLSLNYHVFWVLKGTILSGDKLLVNSD